MRNFKFSISPPLPKKSLQDDRKKKLNNMKKDFEEYKKNQEKESKESINDTNNEMKNEKFDEASDEDLSEESKVSEYGKKNRVKSM